MDYSKYKILLVDDEPDILEFISYNLRKNGFNIITATGGKEAIEKAKLIQPHLVLLDVMMPDIDGIGTCEELRKIPQLEKTVIAFLTARGEDYSQIAGFEAGGDDYITKPIKPKVLISRIKALLKRYGGIVEDFPDEKDPGNKILKKGNLVMDRDKFIVIKNKKEMFLPKKEFELLSLLVSRPEKVFTRDEIFQTVWGDNIVVGDRTIDVHIRKLREKIGDKHIKTVKGVGYKYVE
jgi:two-component system alkaline phosphatase synthesis response regulator PhoP